MLNTTLLYKTLRYSIQGTLIYLLFRYLSKSNMKDYEILLVTLIVVLSCVLLENFCEKYGKKTSSNILEDLSPNGCLCAKEGYETVTKENTEVEEEVEAEAEAEADMENMGTGKNVNDNENVNGVESDANEVSKISVANKPEERKRSYKATEGAIYDEVLEEAAHRQRGRRSDDGVIEDELKYTDYGLLPVAEGYKSRDYEYGYSFLPPEKWYPQPPRPPICVTEKRCPVCPGYTTGTPMDVKEYNKSRRITPPDQINVDYVKEKINSGR